MDFIDKLEKVSIMAGFKSAKHLFFIYFLPATVFLVLLLFFFITFPILPVIVVIPTILSLLGVVFFYPFMEFNSQKKSIHDNLHYFITYAGTISTMDVSRDVLFKRISEKVIFGEISKIFGKIYYLAKKWTLGYARASRKTATQVASPIFADFLDRLAVVMDFGQDLKKFLIQEQTEILNDFATEYKKSLESIELFKEVFVAVTISVAFLVGMGLLAPLLMEIPVELIVLLAAVGVLVLDVIMVFSILSVLPKDKLIIRGKHKCKGLYRVRNAFVITFALSVILFLVLYATDLPLMVVFAISSFPLIIPGMMAGKEEKLIVQKDFQFPVYARTLGASIDVGNRGVISALRSTQVHDFGALNNMSHNLYRRLRVGSDKMKSWEYFAEESGSDLINNFSRIYIESIYLGGNAQEIGEIVSNNVSELNTLRKHRVQASKTLRGTLYGALIGIVGTIFISAQISETLVNVFNSLPDFDNSVVNVAGSILPSVAAINFEQIYVYIAVLVLIHSIASAVIMKFIDGGSMYGCLIDVVNMLIIGALMAVFLPPLTDMILPDIQSMSMTPEG